MCTRFIYRSPLLMLFVSLVFMGCTSDYEFENQSFENVLVVDGMITNLVKKHRVVLSRSYAFGQSTKPEKGAQVWVETDEGDRFPFVEKSGSYYEAVQPFGAQAGKNYSLNIRTLDGDTYTSKPMALPPTTALERLYAKPTLNDLDEPGIGVFIDVESPSNDARLYRFEYEETYKVVAPRWTPYDAIVTFEGFSTFETAVILRETEEQTCYGFQPSEKIMLRSTLNQTLDRIDEEEILFLPIDSSKLIYRYSVLVRLLVENPETYTFFETLKGLSAKSASFFNSIQPGYLAGNLRSLENETEKVAGFFRVSAAAEERIFVQLNDYYPEAETPPYFYYCGFEAPSAEGGRGNRALLNAIYEGTLRFYGYNRGEYPGGPYIMVSAACGDCTVLGSNRMPDFWTP